MNADMLALAVMDDDGWGSAITTEPAGARYIARFTPEAWIRDYAVEVDADGPQEWDCTAYATEHAHTGEGCRHDRLAYLDWLERCGKGTLAGEGVLDNDDVFRDDPAAPSWVAAWQGPFTIRIRTTEGT